MISCKQMSLEIIGGSFKAVSAMLINLSMMSSVLIKAVLQRKIAFCTKDPYSEF